MTRSASRSLQPWLQTASGAAWPLLAPKPSHVNWRDVANSLARLCRFNGHVAEETFYSVAEHCCRVADALPADLRLHGLLHDAHEAFIGDITQPLKQAMATMGAGPTLAALETTHDRAIFAAAGLPYPPHPEVAKQVKHADLRLLATERRDLLAESRLPWLAMPDPLPAVIHPWPWQKAADEWLARLRLWLPASTAIAGMGSPNLDVSSPDGGALHGQD